MIDFAFAADATSQTSSMLQQFGPLVLIFFVFYLLILRPQQKKMKAHQQMVSEITKGDEIVTSSGIGGKITRVGDRFFSVEVAPGVEIQVERHAVSTKLEKGTLKN